MRPPSRQAATDVCLSSIYIVTIEFSIFQELHTPTIRCAPSSGGKESNLAGQSGLAERHRAYDSARGTADYDTRLSPCLTRLRLQDPARAPHV